MLSGDKEKKTNTFLKQNSTVGTLEKFLSYKNYASSVRDKMMRMEKMEREFPSSSTGRKKTLSKKGELIRMDDKEISHSELEHTVLSERNQPVNGQKATDQLEEIHMQIINRSTVRSGPKWERCR